MTRRFTIQLEPQGDLTGYACPNCHASALEHSYRWAGSSVRWCRACGTEWTVTRPDNPPIEQGQDPHPTSRPHNHQN